MQCLVQQCCFPFFSQTFFPHRSCITNQAEPFLLFLQAWGWVQEMYGFAIGAFKAGIERFDLHLQMMAQVRDTVVFFGYALSWHRAL